MPSFLPNTVRGQCTHWDFAHFFKWKEGFRGVFRSSSTSWCRYSVLTRCSSRSLALAFFPSGAFSCWCDRSALKDSSIPVWLCSWHSLTQKSTKANVFNFGFTNCDLHCCHYVCTDMLKLYLFFYFFPTQMISSENPHIRWEFSSSSGTLFIPDAIILYAITYCNILKSKFFLT